MRHTPKPLQACLIACAALLALLAGCATQTSNLVPPHAGAVVVAPRVNMPPPPTLVQQTPPKPVGYFQQSLLDYFSRSPVRPTTSTQPMPAAVQTHTP